MTHKQMKSSYACRQWIAGRSQITEEEKLCEGEWCERCGTTGSTITIRSNVKLGEQHKTVETQYLTRTCHSKYIVSINIFISVDFCSFHSISQSNMTFHGHISSPSSFITLCSTLNNISHLL